MDQGTLVEMLIDDGNRLIGRLVEEGFPVAGACWLRGAEDGQWFVYIATPLVDAGGGTKAVYRLVNTVIRQMQPPFWINPLEIKLVGAGSPIGKALKDLHGKYPGPSPIRYGGTRFG